jgi:CRP/FNR family cyclic AMP-dependent transcriptional regulator
MPLAPRSPCLFPRGAHAASPEAPTGYGAGVVEASRLRKIEVFSELPEDALELLAGRAKEASADEGDVVIKAGAFADQLLAIEEGSVEVQRKDETVAKLGAGDVIGETGVVRHALRNATVVATSPLRALIIAHSDIKQIRREHPDFDERLQAVMEERAR